MRVCRERVTPAATRGGRQAWLVGASLVANAAREFVHASPPTAPCIAEYGVDFPRFIASRVGTERAPYLRDFAELEWAIGVVSIAIDEPPVTSDAFAGVEENAIPDLALKLQPGVRYVESAWPIDDLIKLYVIGSAPETFVLDNGFDPGAGLTAIVAEGLVTAGVLPREHHP
jgi:hypothetical protein